MDSGLNRIQVFNSNGDFIRKIENVNYINDNALNKIVIDNQNNIYLIDFVNKNINIFNSDFEFISSIYYNIREADEYFDVIIHDFKVDSSGSIYIPDDSNYKIKMFKKNY